MTKYRPISLIFTAMGLYTCYYHYSGIIDSVDYNYSEDFKRQLHASVCSGNFSMDLTLNWCYQNWMYCSVATFEGDID